MEKRVAGTLIRIDDLWKLDLVGTLSDEMAWGYGLALVPPVDIYGSCLGVRYTLKKCYLVNSQAPGSNYDVPSDSRDRDDDQHSERWHGYTLLEGECLPDDSLFSSVIFEITGLSSWWPSINLRIDRSKTPEPEFAKLECGDGLALAIGSTFSESYGINKRSTTGIVLIQAECEDGATFDHVMDQIVQPIRNLLSIVLSERVEYYRCRLQPIGEFYSNQLGGIKTHPIKVDPEVIDADSESNPYHRSPLFIAKDIDPAVFIPKWLRVVADNPVPIAVAENRDPSGSLQIRVVEMVNAAETLHRSIYDTINSFPFSDKVAEELKLTKLNSKERKRVKSAVRFTEFTLEDRLLQLALGLGEDFCAWFFCNRVADWACVSATVRNALSHGYKTKHMTESDHSVLAGVLSVTQAVIKLRLLVEAGLPTNGELVQIAVRGHEYIDLMHQKLADWGKLMENIRPK